VRHEDDVRGLVDRTVKRFGRLDVAVNNAEGDLVIAHGRFSGFGAPVNWIAADIVRVKDGVLVEHWDVIQDETTQEQSKSGKPMFGDTFPVYA
jgi:predicted SnoaL-like aldol condensation-catalyzing enzyme